MSESILRGKSFRQRPPNRTDPTRDPFRSGEYADNDQFVPAPSAPYFGGGWSLSPGAPEPTTAQLLEMLTRLNNLVDKWRKRAESMRAGFERQRRQIAAMQVEAVEREKLIERLETRARTLDRPRRKA